jgi:protoporphyrinogen oxidase
MSTVILGGGIAGISAAYHAGVEGEEAAVYEQNPSWGGLCDHFTVDGFRFDRAVHLSFAKDKHVRKLFDLSVESFVHPPLAYNYYEGYWLKHPAQNNTFPLKVDEKVRVIMDFINRDSSLTANDYERWLRYQYGDYFAEHFPMRYTRKYWTLEARELTTSWIGNRMYRPSVEEVLRGAMAEDTPNTYYADEMRYPKKGGYKAYLNYMADRSTIHLNKRVISIDTKNKTVEFEDGGLQHYEHLLSSIPLPDVVRLVKNPPRRVVEAGEALCATSIALVSLGFKHPDIPKYLWFYIYDESVPPARVYAPSMKSPDNVPDGKSSLQFEIYFSKYKPLAIRGERLVEHAVDKAEELGWFGKNDINVVDYREVEYGNVVFHKNMEAHRKAIHDFLDREDVIPIGRFGEWAYFWSDQSLLSGRRGMVKVTKKKA